MSRKSKSSVINWGHYLQAKMITHDDKTKLDVLNSSDEKRLSHVNNNINDFVDLIQRVLLKIHDVSAVKFLLDTLLFLFSRSKRFHLSYCSKGVGCYESLLENLRTDKEDILRLCYSLILRVLFRINPKKVKGQIRRLLETTYENLDKHQKNVNMVLVLIQVVMNVTKDRNNRRMFNNTGGLNVVVKVLQHNRNNIQIEYTCCFCVWSLSFLKEYQRAIFLDKSTMFALLHDVLQKQKKEKVKRIILLTFQNFLECVEVVTILVNIGIYPTLLSLKKKTFKDEDIPAILDLLIEKLDVHIKEISSFSEYRQEVLLGKLDWTPTHKSERFWKENIKNFEENNYQMIKKLLEILDKVALRKKKKNKVDVEENNKKKIEGGSHQVLLDDEDDVEAEGEEEEEEEEVEVVKEEKKKRTSALDEVVYTNAERVRTLVVALFDIGQFIRFCPRAKRIITKLGGKRIILNLMNHPHEKVRNQAIMTTQKLLIRKWDHMK